LSVVAREIERKFLVAGDGWRAAADASQDMRQGYLVLEGRSSVRVREAGGEAWLNIKSFELGIERREFEYAIPVADAREMLANLCQGPLLEKCRHRVPVGGHVWEVDEFFGDNAGLVVAEIELGHPDEPFERPSWVGREVSHEPRYYNVRLVRHPFRNWSAAERGGTDE